MFTKEPPPLSELYLLVVQVFEEVKIQSLALTLFKKPFKSDYTFCVKKRSMWLKIKRLMSVSQQYKNDVIKVHDFSVSVIWY